MDIATSTRFLRKLEFEKREKGNKQEGAITIEAPEETKITPETEPVTASIEDVLAAYNQGGITFVSNIKPIKIPEGVSIYSLDGNDITVYRKGDDIKGQIVGYNVNLNDILKRFADWKAVEPTTVDSSNTTHPSGVNGEIDEYVEQGGTGDCWLLTGVLALGSTEVGKNIIKNSITTNPDGSVTVNFKGVGVSYTISLDEIKEHDTDNNKGDSYSNGDNDMLVLELAVEKLKNDIASGKVKLNVTENSYEGYNGDNGEIEGGFPQQLLYFLTGEESITATAKHIRAPRTDSDPAQTFITESYINQIFNEALENGNTAITFGLYDGTHSAKLTNGTDFTLPLGSGGHALAVTKLTKDTVTFVNPWDSTKEYTMTWAEFAKLGIGMITTTDLSGLEEIVEPNKPTTPDPVTPDEPVNPATPYDKSVAELKAQGFSQADIDEYFDISEDGTYTIKSDIKFKGYQSISDAVLHRNYSEISITTIEELKDYCGTNQRQALKEEGWSDELIDKYFSKHKKYNGKMYYSFSNNGNTEFFDGHVESFDSNANNKGYTITKNKDGSTIISIKRADGETKITVKTDGTYTEDFIRDALCSTSDELKQKGFTQEQIDEWFTEVADGVYKMNTNQALASGDYSNSLKTFNSIEELAKYIGADSRATLKSQGIPDEIIDKFFELKRTGANGSFSYELKIEGNYTITEQGENKLIRIENKEDDTITEILVKKDGTYTIETNEIITIGEKEEANPVAGSVDELLAQGFTQADINKYFYKKNNQYYLKSDITFQKQGANGYETVNIRTLEELKEYSGANSRKALKDQGLPDELIDKYYHKRTENGKIVYTSDDTRIGKDGNNTVLTWSDWSNIDGGAPCREYTIQPDGTYKVVEYTSNQITDTTRTHYMLTRKGLSEQDIQRFFTEKDGLYTLKKGIMYKGQYITTVEELVDALNKNK